MKLHAVNLLPHRVWKQQAHRHRFVVEAVAVALLVAVLAVAGGFWLVMQRDARQQDITQYRARLAQAQALALQRRQAQEAYVKLQAQQADVRALEQHQLDVVDVWGRVAQALPDGVYLAEVKWSPTARSLSGVGVSEGDALALQQGLGAPPAGWQRFELIEVSALPSPGGVEPTRKRFLLRALPNRVGDKP